MCKLITSNGCLQRPMCQCASNVVSACCIVSSHFWRSARLVHSDLDAIKETDRHECVYVHSKCDYTTRVLASQRRCALSLVPQKRGDGETGMRTEPGNIHGKSCWLPPPCSAGTNQIAEQKYMCTWHFVHLAKNCQLENELVSVDYTLNVKNSFQMCRRGASPESPRSKFAVQWNPS